MTDPADRPDGVSRRAFVDHFLRFGGLACAAGMAGPAAAYLWPAGSRGPAEKLVDAGPLSDLPVGAARTILGRGQPILVVRSAADRVRAFSAICTHLGCLVRWDAARGCIACPGHAGVFSADGEVVSGPPPRPLREFPVVVSGDAVRVRVG